MTPCQVFLGENGERTRSARRVAVARARGGETRARGSGGERGRGRTFGVARGARRSEGRARWRGAWKCDATDRLDALFTRQIDISPFHVTRILTHFKSARVRVATAAREYSRAADAIGRFKQLRSRARRAASLIRIRSRRSRRAAHSRPSVALALSPSRPVARTSRRSAAPPSASSRARAGWRRSRERLCAVRARSARASPCSTSSTSSRFTGRTTATR